MKNKILISLLLLSSIILASGGSIYSRYGIGNLLVSNSARDAGTGFSGLAYAQHDHISLLNPAGWHKIDMTRFSTGVSFTGYDIADMTQSTFYSETDFSGFLIAFPISNDYGITFVGGLTPYSNINYDVLSDVDDPILGKHTFEYSGDGGLSKAFLGFSYKLPFDLALGGTFDYYSDKSEYKSSVKFDQNTDFANTEYVLGLKSRGLGFSFGLISPDLSQVLNIDGLSQLRLGATYQFGMTLKVDSVGAYNNSNGYEDYLSKGFDREIPHRLGLGLAFNWSENYTFMVDFVNQPFSQFKENKIKSEYLRDFYRYSIGFEYRHASSRYGSTWQQVIWRGGLSYEQTQFIFNGKGIDEMAAYAGVSFPMGFDNSIDIGLKYGIRGTTDFNLLKENIFAAFITINFGDLWFIRPER